MARCPDSTDLWLRTLLSSRFARPDNVYNTNITLYVLTYQWCIQGVKGPESLFASTFIGIFFFKSNNRVGVCEHTSSTIKRDWRAYHLNRHFPNRHPRTGLFKYWNINSNIIISDVIKGFLNVCLQFKFRVFRHKIHLYIVQSTYNL